MSVCLCVCVSVPVELDVVSGMVGKLRVWGLRNHPSKYLRSPPLRDGEFKFGAKFKTKDALKEVPFSEPSFCAHPLVGPVQPTMPFLSGSVRGDMI